MVYRKGKENIIADALLRRPATPFPDHYHAISRVSPDWHKEIQASYMDDITIQDILAALNTGSNAYPHYSSQNGLLRYKI